MKTITLSSIRPNSANPRRITDEKLRMLGKSMKEFGDLSGIVFNVRTGRLVGGHQRIKHFDSSWEITKREHHDKLGTVALGEVNTPFGVWQYREVDWPENKEIAANIAANQHGGIFDFPKLTDLVMEIDDGALDMELIGFSEDELKRMNVDAPFTPEINPEISINEITKDEIEKRAKKIAEAMHKEKKMQGIICPECGHEFYIEV